MSDEQIPLSDREMEIVRLLATGATNQQIARELIISVNTVKVHLRNIYGKLDVASRTEATMVAVSQGWVEISRPEETTAGTKAAASMPGAEALEAVPGLPLPRGRLSAAHVSLPKRIGLMVASLLALVILFLPQVLQGGTNGPDIDPIGGVFPTAPTGSSTTRWQTRAQMPTPRTGLAVVPYGGQVYAIGGVGSDGVTGKVEVYDPTADAWTTARPKPTPVGFVSGVEVGGKIYVPGGIDAGRQRRDILEIYDPVQDRWEEGTPLPEPLAAYGITAQDGEIYLFGGVDGQGYLSSIYRYDPETDSWAEMEPMAQPRGFLAAATLGDRIYVVGGYDDVTEFATCDAYDPVADSWAPCASMSTGRGGLALVPVREQLYAIGGGMDGYLAFNERYDPRVDAWTQIESPVMEQWRDLGAAFVHPNLYAIGGWNGDFLSVNETYRALYQITLP